MKKVATFLLFCIAAIPLFAATEVVNGIEWSYTISDNKATIESGNNNIPAISKTTQGTISIPATLGGYTVTSIGRDAFIDCSLLTSVVIPDSVTSIGGGAFWNCSSLTAIDISDGVTSIGVGAFLGCSSLTTINIPNGVISIRGNMFQGCSSLKSIEIPESVTTIGLAAFRSCSTLKAIDIPNSVIFIEELAFSGCSALESINIPDSVTSIENSTFSGCSSLESINIPNSVALIGNSAFSGCSSLESINIPNSVALIGNSAFSGCSSLMEIDIPGSVTSIGEGAFSRCLSLTSVDIPNGVMSIGQNAFENCSSLIEVAIPGSIQSFGNGVFKNCSALSSVKISDGLTSIVPYSFYGCSSLTSIKIPNSVSVIGRAAIPIWTKVKGVGEPPEWISTLVKDAPWMDIVDRVEYPKEYAEAWETKWEHEALLARQEVGAYTQASVQVKAEMMTPKTMKVTYTVISNLPTVKIRAVAWESGAWNFRTIVPIRTGKGIPNGESMATNEEHSFVWDVASDWSTDLNEVRVEILVQEGTLLPQDLVTIPSTETRKAMTITRNVLESEWLFFALVWCYAEMDPQLSVTEGRVYVNGQQVAEGGSLSFYGRNQTVLLNYLYGKMGYKVLAGEDLKYAEAATRLDFSDSGLNQVSVKIEEE